MIRVPIIIRRMRRRRIWIIIWTNFMGKMNNMNMDMNKMNNNINNNNINNNNSMNNNINICINKTIITWTIII